MCVLRYIYREVRSPYYLDFRVEINIRSELPSNLLLKKMSPKIWLPLLTSVWGVLTMCLGFVTSFASFVTVRALLGVAEGGLLPGMVSLQFYSSISFPAHALGTLPLAILPQTGTRASNRHFLHGGLAVRCVWRFTGSWAECNWTRWRP